MSTKQLSFLTAIGAIAFGTATSVLAETSTHSPVTFSCEVNNNGVPTTVLKSADAQKTIFNWSSDLLTEARNPVDLCNEVTAKLNSYSADRNNDLSVLTFKADVQADLPTICVTDDPAACNRVLFTLPRTEKPETIANGVLGDILDPGLQTTKQVSNQRGVQYFAHSVSLLELILGPKVMKSY
jgi:hypothetical protein